MFSIALNMARPTQTYRRPRSEKLPPQSAAMRRDEARRESFSFRPRYRFRPRALGRASLSTESSLTRLLSTLVFGCDILSRQGAGGKATRAGGGGGGPRRERPTPDP